MRRVAFSIAVWAGMISSMPSVGADLGVQLVAHPQVKGSQIPREILTSIFLRQAQRWGDGSVVLPVDQSVQSEVRNLFSSRILKKPLFEVQAYWRRAIPSGVVPPPVKGSDDAVLAYVASTPGAIGYIAASTPVPFGVKTLELAKN